MIDLSNLKSPGWQRVVAELVAPANDNKQFLDRLLRVMSRVSAARQGVLWVPAIPGADTTTTELRALSIWPAAGPGSGSTGAGSSSATGGGTGGGANAPGGLDDRVAGEADNVPVEFVTDARSAAYAALESGQCSPFGLERQGPLYDPNATQGYLLAVPLIGAENKPVAAITLLVEPRNRQAVQSTLAMAEVLAGYVYGHAARQALRRAQAGAVALDLATRLLAGINSAPGFKGCCLHLVNELAKQFGADRCALGWTRGDQVRVVAISDTEHFDRRTHLLQKLEAAMDECLDQSQPVLHPAPGADEDALLARAIGQAHRELASGQAGLRVCSVPLRDGEDVVGVLTLEASPRDAQAGAGGPAEGAGRIDPAAVELLQAAADLLAPVLRVRRNDDRALALRGYDWGVRTASWVVGPRHTVWKLAGLGVMAAMLFVTFYTTTYRVGAEAVLQPRTRQVVSAPFDGLIASVPAGIEAGVAVRAGDVLAELDTREFALSAADARQKIAQAQKQMTSAMAESKMADAQRARAQIERARAELALAELRIEQSRIVAPIDGTIIAGRLVDQVGSSVSLGDRLYELAPLSEMLAVARVDERDVAFIEPGGRGRIAARARPGERFEFVVESIVPLAAAEEGKNRFEVRGRLLETTGWMRPGMEGLARLDAGERSLLSIGTRRLFDEIRLWLW